MLCELNIRNFILIDQLSLKFRPGFNVLTGETGAGKSIIIGAIDLILGGKARPDLIRSGADEAQIETLFDLQAAPLLRAELEEAGLDNGADLLVRRTISRSGKNRIYLNGSLATATQLQNWISRLVSIYGQHEQLGLVRPESHTDLLDRFSGVDEELTEYRACFEQIKLLQDELSRLDLAEQNRQQRLDLLSYQRREITEAALRSGEEEELLAERSVMQHAEKLRGAAELGYESLYGCEGAACERLTTVTMALRELTRIDLQLGHMADTIESAFYTLEDVAMQLRDYAGKIFFDPVRLDQIEARLGLLAFLKRKYGHDITSILEFLDKIEKEYSELVDLASSRNEFLRLLTEHGQRLQRLGMQVTLIRREATHQFQRRVETELRDLAMARARFEPRLIVLPEPGPQGFEKIEFFLQANPGEEARPLARVASGGELSRLMLAIRRAAPTGEETATLIFDEVDAGVGGAAATAIGEKLQGVSVGRQVLCITHLPQVAAFADHHYQVHKEEAGGRTITEVLELNGEARINEVARMLGGAKITEQTLAHARELIRLSMPHQKNTEEIT